MKLARSRGSSGTIPVYENRIANIVLGTTRHDRVTSFLMSLIITIGFLTCGAATIWYLNLPSPAIETDPPEQTYPVELEVEAGGVLDGAMDETMRSVGPDQLNIPVPNHDYSESPESDFPEPSADVEDVLDEIPTVLAPDNDFLEPAPAPSGGVQSGNSKKPGFGIDGGPGGIPSRSKRWELRYDSHTTLAVYTRKLDFFQIEVGCIVDGTLYYVSRLSQATPQVRSVPDGKDESRLYFSHRSGARQQADRELLKKAGVPVSKSAVVLHFIPKSTEALMAQAEKAKLSENGVDIKLVRKSRFKIAPAASGYRMVVVSQDYFRAP